MTTFSQAFKQYDPKQDAEWVEHEGAKFLIAPFHNKHFHKVMSKKYTVDEAQGYSDYGINAFADMKQEDAVRKVSELYCEALVVDWELEDENGKELKYTPKRALEFLTENHEFFAFVISESKRIQLAQLEKLDEIKKKSEK